MREALIILVILAVLVSYTACQSGGDYSGNNAGSADGGGTPSFFPVTQIPPITYGNLTCGPYDAGGTCQLVLHTIPVIYNHSRGTNMEIKEDLDLIFHVLSGPSSTGSSSSPHCTNRAGPLLCLFTFPFCDPAFGVPVYQPICRKDCLLMRNFYCPSEWQLMENLGSLVQFGHVDSFNCDLLGDSEAGDAPMCISMLDGGPIPSFLTTGEECYSGRGRGYNGTLDVTASGYTCQNWNLNYPHASLLQLYSYPELGDHNYCRNPGEKGEKPWCFTTNTSVRWEYCNVSQCDHGPTCQRYTGTLCNTNGSIGLSYVYINTSLDTQEEYEMKLTTIFQTLAMSFKECEKEMAELLCHVTFPLCDIASTEPRPHKVCNEYCHRVKYGKCQRFYTTLTQFAGTVVNFDLIPQCDGDNSTHYMDGGTNPECYAPAVTNIIGETTTTCYNETTSGTDYIGTTNVTVSGRTCQPWDVPSPHPHPFTSLFRGYLSGHNYCRNPEGRGQRPWCYTTDPAVRWEYCPISSCIVTPSSSPSSDNQLPTDAIIGGSVGGGAFIIVVFCCCCCCCCYCCYFQRKSNSYIIEDTNFKGRDEEKIPMTYVHSSGYNLNPLRSRNPLTEGVGPLDEYTHIKLPEYNRDKLIYICDLGEGHFGLVIRAEAPDIMSQEPNSTVAVKVLKEGASSATKTEFFREASLMAGFDHPNILKLLGVCIEQEPLCMIFEYMEMGDLNNFLRENAPPYLHSFPCTGPKTLPDRLSVKGLVDISKDIAAGLAYLSKNHYVHRDLATRNCLVNKALRVKIADFGLSQDVYSNDYFRLGDSELLPVRWMPPEAILYSKFTICSDIWSFGVVLWETFSYGIQPYYGMSNEEVVQYVRECNVLKCPQKCPQEIYDLMLDCWNIDPQERPKAYEISEGLDKWTPDLSAQLEVQTRHPDYQNMSTILEWARRSRETGNYYLLEDPDNQNGDVNQNGGTSMLEADNHVENGNKKINGNYDHLKPVEEETDKENVNKINIY